MTETQKSMTILRKLATRKPFACTNTKKDGSLRTWRGVYRGGRIRGVMVVVFDLDKREDRTLNVATIHTFGLIEEKWVDRPAQRAASNWRERAEYLFG